MSGTVGVFSVEKQAAWVWLWGKWEEVISGSEFGCETPQRSVGINEFKV